MLCVFRLVYVVSVLCWCVVCACVLWVSCLCGLLLSVVRCSVCGLLCLLCMLCVVCVVCYALCVLCAVWCALCPCGVCGVCALTLCNVCRDYDCIMRVLHV